MGVDLSLLPFDHDNGDWAFSHTVMSCMRRRDLFNEIQEIPTKEVPDDFTSYLCRDDEFQDPHYGNTQVDAYGHPLEWCYVKDLCDLFDHDDVQDNSRHQAIWAYLHHLDDKTKVALYWH